MPLHGELAPRPVTLAWLDAEEAVLFRWPGSGGPPVDPVPKRLRSEVPSRHRATGQVSHDPRRPGGGGIPDDRLERRREHLLDAFVRAVAARIPPDDRVVLMGPGPVRERLAGEIRATDLRTRRTRSIESHPTGRLTERQLQAQLRIVAGTAPERRGTAADGTGGGAFRPPSRSAGMGPFRYRIATVRP
jgi:hypothetical protein